MHRGRDVDVKISNATKLREGVPVTIFINGSAMKPRISISDLGNIEVKKTASGYEAVFWTMQAGTYNIFIDDGSTQWQKNIIVSKQDYLDFGREFSFFALLLAMTLLGVALWIKKKKSTP